MNKKSAILALTAALCAGSAASAADSIGDRFHYFGIMGNRYDHMDVQGVTDKSFVGILNLSFKINDHMTFESTSELHKMYHKASESWDENGTGTTIPGGPYAGYKTPNDQADWNHLFEQAYVNAKWDVAKLNVKAGRFDYFPAYGITHGDYLYVSGVQVGFNVTDAVRATLTGGQNTQFVPGGTYNSMGYYAAEVAAAVVPGKTNVKLSYQKNQSGKGLAPAFIYDLVNGKDDTYYSYFEGGADTKLPMNLSAEAAFIKSSYDTDNKGYYAQLKYGGAIPFVPNTFDVYVAYHNLESSSIQYNDLRYYPNMKGVRIGAHYTPVDCVLITAWYDIQKYINDGTSSPTGAASVLAGQKDNFFRLQVDFFFK